LQPQRGKLWKNCRRIAEELQKNCRRIAEELQKNCRRIAEELQKNCRRIGVRSTLTLILNSHDPKIFPVNAPLFCGYYLYCHRRIMLFK
jgi:hypothetical protein